MSAAETIAMAQEQLGQLTGQLQGFVSDLQSIAQSPPIYTPGTYERFQRTYKPAKLTAKLEPVTKFEGAKADPLAGLNFPSPLTENFTAKDIPDPTLTAMRDVARPNLSAIQFPTAPNVSWRARPTMLGIEVPHIPEVELRDLDLEQFRPTADLPAAPDFQVREVEREFAQAMTDAQFASWLQALWDGTNLDDGHRLFEAGRDRIVGEGRRAQAGVMGALSARNLRMPSGIMAAALRDVAQGTSGQLADLNREIALKRADQLVQQQQGASAQALQFIDLLKRYAQAAMERALQLQRMDLDAAQMKLTYAVQRYNARLEGMRTFLAAWSEERERALARMQVINQRITAEKLKSDINAQELEAWSKEIAAEQMKVSVYSELMRGAGIQASVNQTIVAAYDSEVRAEIARHGQNELNVRLFEARQRGEQVRASVFGERVRAHGSAVDAAATQARVKIDAMRTSADNYRAWVDGVRAGNDAELASARIVAEQDRLYAELDRIDLQATAQFQSVQMSQEADMTRNLQTAYATQVQAIAAALQALGSAIGGASSAIAGVAQTSDIAYV